VRADGVPVLPLHTLGFRAPVSESVQANEREFARRVSVSLHDTFRSVILEREEEVRGLFISFG
jgi:hypothetical protein